MTQTKNYRKKGTGSIYKHGKQFYLKIRINHKTKTIVLRDQNDQPVTNRHDADKAASRYQPCLLARQKEEIAFYVSEARQMKAKTPQPVESLWNLYFHSGRCRDLAPGTLHNNQYTVTSFISWLQNEHPEIIDLDQITEEIAVEYFDMLWETNITAVTWNKKKTTLNHVFKIVGKRLGLTKNPFSGLVHRSEQPISRKEFTEEQVNAILNGFTTGFFYTSEQERFTKGRVRIRELVKLEYVPRNKDEMFVLLNLCCWTGCRGQDGCLMKWENVDWKNRQITFIPQKTAKKTAYRSVSLPIHDNLYAALERAKEWRSENQNGEDYILPKVAHRYQTNPSGVQKDVMKIIRCATGLETTGTKGAIRRVYKPNLYSLHSFRHTFVSFCANAGVPLDVIASIVGHSSVAMTRHYTHISPQAKEKAIAALPVLKAPEENSKSKQEILQQFSQFSEEELLNMLKHNNKTAS